MSRLVVRVPQFVLPMLVTAAIAVFVLLLDGQVQERYRVEERADVLHRLSTIRARLEGGLNSRLYLTQGLVSYVVTHPDVSQAGFQHFAHDLIAGKTAIRSIQLARGTVVSHVYPLQGNEQALGLHLLDLPKQRGAVERALQIHGTVVAGPVHLVQGGVAFISRTPIYLSGPHDPPGRGPYWGLATILIDTNQLLQEAGVEDNPQSGLQLVLRGTNGRGPAGSVFYGNPNVLQRDPVVQYVGLPNGSWQLAAIPTGGWVRWAPNSEWLLGGGLLLALLAGALTWMWARYPQRLWQAVQRATTDLRRARAELEVRVSERTAELTATNAALRESEARLAEAQQIATIGNWVWEIGTNELFWSDQVYRIFGVQPRQFEATYDAFLQRVHPADRKGLDSAVLTALETGQPFSMDHRIVLPDGSERVVHEQARVDYEPSGKPVRMTGTVQDITERKRNEMQLEHMAYHDALTGLPNRALMRDRIGHALARARRTRGHVALLFLDLDRFKNVNDSLGHDVGDRLLVQVAERLVEHEREEDTLARLGGDEFTILIEDISDPEQAASVAAKLRLALGRGFEIDGREIFLSASIGISLFPADGEDADTLMKHADAAMYRAKEGGRNGYRFYSRDMGERARERLALENELRRALDRDELRLRFQPIVDMASGRIAAFEALLRWQHPERGLLEPGHFVGLAEESGQSVAIGRWVLRAVCAQSAAWKAMEIPRVRVWVNLSARQFSEGDLAGEVGQLLADTGLRPQCLGLEITENTLLTDSARVDGVLAALQRMGVPVAIDDFGQGHSALAYLKRLNVSTLKIDRAFVRDLTVDPNDAAIIEAIIAMGHKLNLSVVGEGVEAPEQAARLQAAGCDYAQGRFYGAPVPAEQVPDLLAEHGVLRECCEPPAASKQAAAD